MRIQYKFHVTVALLLVALTACNVPPPPAAPGAKPIPKDKEAVLAEMRPLLSPYRAILANPTGPGLPDSQRADTLAAIRTAQAEYGQEEYAQAAMRELGQEIAALAIQAKDQERWRLVEALIDVYEVLNLQSYLLDSLDRRAELILAKPKVVVKGFMEDGKTGQWSVFMEVTDRNAKKSEKVVKQVGDVFNNLKLREIVGDNNAIKLEYLRIPDLVFTVEGISRLSKAPA